MCGLRRSFLITLCILPFHVRVVLGVYRSRRIGRGVCVLECFLVDAYMMGLRMLVQGSRFVLLRGFVKIMFFCLRKKTTVVNLRWGSRLGAL